MMLEKEAECPQGPEPNEWKTRPEESGMTYQWAAMTAVLEMRCSASDPFPQHMTT